MLKVLGLSVAVITMQSACFSATFEIRSCKMAGQACGSCEAEGMNITPKVNRDQNVVLLNVETTDEKNKKSKNSQALTNCKIVDDANWSCIAPGASLNFIRIEANGYKMVDGELLYLPSRWFSIAVVKGKYVERELSPHGSFFCAIKKPFFSFMR